MKKVLFVITLLAAVIFIAGCTGGEVVCNDPYIQVGAECCLDKNSNNICDSDEGGAAPTPEAPAPTVDMKSLLDDDAVKGDKNAPVTIVEWSDFGCFFCEKFYVETLGQIEEEYVKTGKVKIVYRDFPWEEAHPGATKAAEAAECAADQGKFWEMHDMIFEDKIEGGVGGVTAYKQYASKLGLNTKNFNTCLDSGKYADEIEKDKKDGIIAGIKGTPGFIIGPSDGKGVLVSGAQPFAVFKLGIDKLLAE
ncbi:thioredoxin domain-containing protein [Candidatus Woesearchaeota archaeon]|jgi:protein-disulfide isomerase|nr:thioredoxin domain-containing protein [Candidatus Woesearchaeota archaeon]MBT4150619.1 thioredoxin domain-containing protein [Candidatus Woesearchaeota archaeon]MBT4247837.1 thioredoxin domain-containing protein [Candidatus Woesearchaeota archaeon]MBT4434261.1 thioredoxin domain-containing protein [Candidatus Woesearchaeota archaeon]MBT7331818.1 thioredoxin domain-containing protein [Candidatus Woesearchaeota archaeon]